MGPVHFLVLFRWGGGGGEGVNHMAILPGSEIAALWLTLLAAIYYIFYVFTCRFYQTCFY